VGKAYCSIGTPVDERKCIICHTVKDEFHFVCECKMYVIIRKSLLPKYYWKIPNMFKFIELIKSDIKHNYDK